MQEKQGLFLSVRVRKRLFFAFLAALPCLLLLAQPVTVPAADSVIEWTRQFGTAAHDSAFSSTTDHAGNTYLAGETWGALPGGSGWQGLEDAFLRKYDSSGNTIWTRQFGTEAPDDANGAATDTVGNVYVVGETSGALPGGDGSKGAVDAYIRKYDSSGDILWTRQFGTPDADWNTGAATDSAGNVYVVGSTEGTLPGGGGSQGSLDAYVRKYDSQGNVVWTRQFGDSGSDWAYGTSTDSSGNVYVVGETFLVYPVGGGPSPTMDAYVRKYDSSGTVLWTNQFGINTRVGPDSDRASDASTDSDGNVYVVGYTSSPPGGGSLSPYDAFVRKYHSNGSVLWTRVFGSPGGDRAEGVSTDTAGNTYVAGYAGGPLPGSGGLLGEGDAFVRKYEPTGDIIWTTQFGTESDDEASDTSADSAGNIYVTGHTDGALPGGGGMQGAADAFLVKFGALSLADVSVTCVPDSGAVAKGGTLSYAVTAANNRSVTQTFGYWTYVILPDGSRYPASGELFGPYSVTLPSFGSTTANIVHQIPAVAPAGVYEYFCQVGPYADEWDSDSFQFEVTP